MYTTPILVLTYNRADTLDRTLDFLTSCNDYDKHDYFIHIDAPNIYKNDDKIRNGNVKSIIEKYRKCFRSLVLFEEEYHQGLSKSVISSVNKIIHDYGRIIVIEDDLQLSRDCLAFLEDSLNYYENRKNIWSVTGFCPPLKSVNNSEHSVFLSYRGCSYAWGTWKNRWDKVDWEVSDYNKFKNSYEMRLNFCRGGNDLPEMLKMQMEGFIDSWAVRWVYAQSKYDMLTVYPTVNRAYNIGFVDGTHTSSEFDQTELLEECPPYVLEDYFDETINSEFRSYYDLNKETWEDPFENKTDVYKFESMFNVMHLWRQLNENGHEITEYFLNRNYKTIAIYGRGKIGLHMEKALKKEGIDVKYYIDRNDSLCDGINCLDLSYSLPNCDCIIISVTTGANEISALLKNKFNGPIKGIVDVLKDR